MNGNDEKRSVRRSYRPGAPGDATAEKTGDRWTLVFVRELRHPPEKVWRALTGRDELRAWAPFDADRDLGKTGTATLTMAGASEPVNSSCTVSIAERPRVLEYTWEDDVLRWELAPIAAGTRLTLRHTLADRNFVPKIAAGWQICLDVAEHLLDGNPIGRIVAKEALDFDWERLNDEYAKRFGIENTGVPEKIAGR
jgi:uncharacterized protein YndB with AHSA1/START domain